MRLNTRNYHIKPLSLELTVLKELKRIETLFKVIRLFDTNVKTVSIKNNRLPNFTSMFSKSHMFYLDSIFEYSVSMAKRDQKYRLSGYK